ncbi:hypothetical protein [Paenibacillus polymyxa]|uniref:Uncharacterized protein n=1 Tax=Paenibacillus polymyxa TaxID=1406 RepID=A0ABX2ZAB3_PAEPO|nr:hypothetical protein [Paenibacillus polymyxa]ODA08273.1 hypothetical protein A7312_27795 [Paenibacillus polymyxa]
MIEENRLSKLLNMIGKRAFICYFHILNNEDISQEDKIVLLSHQYKYAGAKIRVDNFVKLKQLKDGIMSALALIESSTNRTPDAFRRQAKLLQTSLYKKE